MSTLLNSIKETATAVEANTNTNTQSGILVQTIGAVIDTAKLGLYITKETINLTRETVQVIPTILDQTTDFAKATSISVRAELNDITTTEQIEIDAYLKTLSAEQRSAVSIQSKLQLLANAKAWLKTL